MIQVSDLGVIRDEKVIFKKLSFSLKEGQAIFLKGSNGSGKTTLLKTLSALLPVTFGTVKIGGKSFSEFESEDYQQMLYLGHNNPIKPQLTVIENLQLNSALFDNINVNQEQAEKALQAVGLLDYKNTLASKLSVGQKRRISLARLWLVVSDEKTHKKIWLLDEPLIALDVDFVQLLQLQIDKHLSLNGSVIFTSHQAFNLKHQVDIFNLDEVKQC